MHIVERYLDAMVRHDWEAMAACLADDVVRIGPFGDTYTPKGPYVDFLAGLMPTLPGYSMRIDRVVEAGPVAVVELTETVVIDGTPIVTPECLVVDLDGAGLIRHIAIYIQRLGEPAPTL
ncbi:MAG TPA: nuclear transport factor 2 family protein [Acidimicrobiales bacterium]|nr:nuclear transport factor 2 family protein [Acidimicrobiales bacterium]